MSVAAFYQYRFYPTPDQADLLSRTFGCVRLVYNRARAFREQAWTERKERVGFSQTSAMLPVLKKDPQYAWLNEVSCVPLQQAMRHLDAAYRNFFRGRAKYPRFRTKDGRQSAHFTKSAFKYRDGALTLAKMDEPLAVAWSRALPSDPSTVVVTREADGRWFISCRVDVEVAPHDAGSEAVGVDMGLADLAILSTGEKIANPHHLAKRQARLARLHRRLSKKQKGSKNRAKAKRKLARAHTAVRNARRDHIHKLSTRLVRENQVICVETLSIKGMLKAKRNSRAIADASWRQLVDQLTYKAAWYGRTLVKIDRFFPSTKTCSHCGSTGHSLPLSVRAWVCPDCGADHDRDVNAAVNIRTAGLAGIACGGGISLGVPWRTEQPPVKQELAS